jgi:ATP-dependent helicase/nuclease subunit A
MLGVSLAVAKAAAAELRSKILAELNRRLNEGEGEQRHLRRQLSLVHLTQISTIHAFCTAFLRENCHLLDLDSDFRVADQQESELLLGQCLDRLLERHYENMTGEFEALLDDLSAGRDDKKLVEITLSIYRRIQAHPSPRQWLRDQSAAFRWQEGTDAGDTKWGNLLMKDAAGQVRYWGQQLELCQQLIQGDDALLNGYGPSLSGSTDAMYELLDALEHGSWDEARSCVEVPFPRLGGARKVQDKAAQSRVKAIREATESQLQLVVPKNTAKAVYEYFHSEEMKK